MIHRGKTFQNIAWLVVERVLRVGATAVVIAMVARQLGPAQFGALNYALLLLGLAMPFATLCFDAVVVHELVRSPAEAPSILGSTFLLRAGAGLASALVFFGLGATGGLGVNYSLLVPVGVMLVLQACEVPELWFQRQLLAQWTAAARVVALAVGAVLKIELVRHHAGVSAFVWAQAAENGLYAIGLAWNYARTGGHLADWRWNQALAQKLARLAWPLALAGTLVGLYLRLDQLLVQRWLPPVDAGIYLAASRVIDMATMAAGVVGASLFPNLAAAYGSDEKGFQARLRSVFDLLSGLGWVVALVFTFAAPWVVALLFGMAYRTAGPILIVKGWACLLLFSGIARGQFVVLTGATHANLAAVSVGLATQALGAVWLMPLFGALGAAIAAAAAAVLSGWLTSFVFPVFRPCAAAQTRGLLVVFQPKQWPACLKLLS